MAAKFLAASVAAVIFFGIPGSALAQAGNWRWTEIAAARGRRTDAAQVSYFELRRLAYDHGYREGFKEGEKDARRGDPLSYYDEKEFRRGDRGYHRSYGDRERYRQLFRDGYASGYQDAYARFGRYGRYERPGPYGRGPYVQRGGYGAPGSYGRYPRGSSYSPAVEIGTRDGYEKGAEDARKNRAFDPRRHSWYRSGDRHYEDEYGPREQYKDLYRQGFLRGYERGYEEGRYRW